MRKWWKEVLGRKNRAPARRNYQRRVLGFECLEVRQLLTTTLTAIQPSFVQEGPAPVTNPKANSTNGLVSVSVGSVQAVALDTSTNGNTAYVGAVNGGVWQTTNYTATGNGPTWTPLTDQDNINIPTAGTAANPANTVTSSGLSGSLAIASLAVDNTVGSLPFGHALIAGTGQYSDASVRSGVSSGPLTGVWEMLPNGGTNSLTDGNPFTWYKVPGIPNGGTYASVAVDTTSNDGKQDQFQGVLTEYILAADNGGTQNLNPALVRPVLNGNLYLVAMTFNGNVPTYTPLNVNGLGAGPVTDVIQDPSNPTWFYAAVGGASGGVYRSMDDGKDWVEIADASVMPELNNAVNIQIAPTRGFTVYVGVVGNDYQLDNVYVSTNDNANLPPTSAPLQGVKWAALGAPAINPQTLGAENFAIAADPNNTALVYVGGDYAPQPNSFGGPQDTGIVYRGNVNLGAGTATFTPLVGSFGQNTSPPAGTREMVVAPNQELVETTNGGIFDRVGPTGSGAWISHNGLVLPNTTQPSNALSTSEFYSVAYNPLSQSIIGGVQDYGVIEQAAQGTDQWNAFSINNPSNTNNSIYNVLIGPIGVSGGQVAVQNIQGIPPVLYGSNDFFNNFFSQNLNATMNPPPAPNPAPAMLVNGSSAQTIYQVEQNAGAGATTFATQTPIAVNAVQQGAIVVGSNYVYESTQQFNGSSQQIGGGGAAWTAIQGLSTTGGNATPLNAIGPVTALAYGGTDKGVANQYILWAGSSTGNLYLRAPSNLSPTGATLTTGLGTYQNPVGTLQRLSSYGGGAPVGIVMNPSNWTLTYVASGSSVTLATVNGPTGGVYSGTGPVGSTTFTTIAGPGGVTMSDIVYVPLTGVNATQDEIVVSGFASGNPTSTGVYMHLVDNTTGAFVGNWIMVGAPADGTQVALPGIQLPELPHAPVSSLLYTGGGASGDTLIVGTVGRGVWELTNFTQLTSKYAMTVSASGTVQFIGDTSTNPTGYFDVKVNGANDTIVAGPNTTLPASLKQFPLPLSAIQGSVIVSLTGATNTLDLNFTNGTPVPSISNVPRIGFVVTAAAGTTNTLTVEDDTANISLASASIITPATSSLAAGTYSGYAFTATNSPATIGLINFSNAILTGGTGNTVFSFTGWTLPATLNGGGGTDTVAFTSTDTRSISYILWNNMLQQTVVGGAALPTITLNGISVAQLTGGSGSNTFNITPWSQTAAGSFISGGSGGNNTILDSSPASDSYIFFNQSGISIGTGSNPTAYRPLIGLSNFQTIGLAFMPGIGNVHYFDQGWLGTVYVDGNPNPGLNGNAVLIQAIVPNTNFALSNTVATLSNAVTSAVESVVNMRSGVQFVALFGGPGSNTYDVSNYHLTGWLTGGGTSNLLVVNEQQDFSVSNTGMWVGPNGSAGNFYLAGMSALNINTLAGNHSVYINNWTGPGIFSAAINQPTNTLSAGTGSDQFYLGGTSSFASLDSLSHFTVLGGSGSTLTLNDVDSYGANRTWYDAFNNEVVSDLDTPRFWGGVNYDQFVNTVTIMGSNASGGTELLVGPSFTNSFVFYGNSNNDFLGVLFYGTEAQNLTILGGANGVNDPTVKKTGYWTFSNPGQPPGQLAVSFQNINKFNNTTPAQILATGTSAGNNSTPLVRVFNGTLGIPLLPVAGGPANGQFTAYDPSFQGGVQVAVGQFQPTANPGSNFIVTAPGPGTPALLKVFTTNGTLVTQVYPFGPGYMGGLNVAVADVTGDGVPDIIVGAQSNNTTVRVIDGSALNVANPTNANLVLGRAFLAYPSSYTGGVAVAAAKMGTNATYADIITVPYSGAPAQVQIFDGHSVLFSANITVVDSYLALPAAYTLGATVAVGNIDADGVPDIIVAAGADGNSFTVVTSGASAMTGTSNPQPLNVGHNIPTTGTFFAYPTPGVASPTFATTTEVPLRIGLMDVLGDGRKELFTGQAAGGDPTGGLNLLMPRFVDLLIAHLSINSAATGGVTISSDSSAN